MKKIIWIVILLAVVGYFVTSHMEKKAKHEAQRAKAEIIQQATRAAVTKMAFRANAIVDWEASLSKGEGFRFEPILTIELERLWFQQRPILFIGAIKDIATHDQSHYLILVERSLVSSFKHMFDTELQLSLVSNKDSIDSLLKEHPNLFKEFGFKNGVAVIARISSIRTKYFLGESGERQEVKIGEGKLEDILFTGDVQF